MKKPYSNAVFGVSLVLVGILIGNVVVGEDAPAESSSIDVSNLKAERVETLQKVVTILDAIHRSTPVEPERLFSARSDLIDAQLEQADTKAERLTLLKEHYDLAMNREALAEQRFRVATGSRVECLQAKAIRLQREIALLQETDG